MELPSNIPTQHEQQQNEDLEKRFISALNQMQEYLNMRIDSGDDPFVACFETLNTFLAEIKILDNSMRQRLYNFINTNRSWIETHFKKNTEIFTDDKYINYELIYKHNLGGWFTLIAVIAIDSCGEDNGKKIVSRLEDLKKRAFAEKNEKFLAETLLTYIKQKHPEIDETFLQEALKEKFEKGESVFFLLMNLGLNDPMDKGKKALHWIAKNSLKNDKRNITNLKFILQNGYQQYLNQPDSTNKTPLRNAINIGNAVAVKAFLEAGAIANQEDVDAATVHLKNSSQIYDLLINKLSPEKKPQESSVKSLAESMSKMLSATHVPEKNETKYIEQDSLTNKPW